MGRGLAFLLVAGALAFGSTACRPLYGDKPDKLRNPEKKKRPPEQPEADLDLLSYGEPAELPFDVSDPDRRFDYRIGRRPGFVNGLPGMWWSINGRLFPDVPMYMVSEGDVAVFRIENGSGEYHPMHLHGFLFRIMERSSAPVALADKLGWKDTVGVLPNETVSVLAWFAPYRGKYVFHCHSLEHADKAMMLSMEIV